MYYKKIILSLAVFCGLFFSVHTAEAGTLVRPPNNLGLVGYWNFNEATGTIATDYSGNGNTGTLTNSPTWTTGKFDSALQFSGSRYVLVPTDNGFSNKATGTVSVWFFATSTSNSQHLWRSGQVSADNPSVYTTGGVLSYHNQSSEMTVATMTDLVGNWHHIVSTWTSAGRSVYLDGVLVNSGSAPTAWGTGFHIGSNNNDAASWVGKIDEVRMYNRALSASQVSSLYNSGGSKFGSSNSLTQGTSLNNGLRGHWTFDGKDMVPNVRDVSGNGNHGNLTFFNSTTSVLGKLGQGLDFNNPALGSNDFVDAGSASSLDNLDTQGGGGMPVVFWMKPRTAGGFGQGNIVAKADSGFSPGTGNWAVRHSGVNAIRLEKSFATTVLEVNSASSYTADEWQLAAMTWDGTSNATNGVKFYRNGLLVSNGSFVDGQGAKDSDAAASLVLGNQNRLYDGSLDDVRVYNRVLSISEIKQLYNLAQGKTNASSTAVTQGTPLTNGLVGLWTFDGQDTVTSVTDKSGQGNNGQFVGGATSSAKTIGKLGQALQFDGINDYVSVPDADILTPATITIAGWYKHTSLSGGIPYYIQRADANNRIDIFIGDSFFCTFSNGTTYNSGSYAVPAAYKTGWHHLACTWDGQTVRSYIDGVLVYTEAFAGTLPNINTSLFFGTRSFSSWYVGAMDDIRLYNRALSNEEIKQLYTMGN